MIKKTTFIIGASSGIGFECANFFSNMGYNVIATYNNGSLENLRKECTSLVGEVKMDVSNYESVVDGFSKAFEISPYIESVIFCSGICENEMLLCDMTRDQIERILDINLKGCIFANREAMKYFTKQKHGNIVNISSIDGVYGCACESVYAATKAGIDGLTKSLAIECAPYGIRVNSVAPGFIETRMTNVFSEEDKNDVISKTPLGRLGQTLDIAKAVFYLATDDSSFVTGEILNVNGGAVRF